MDITKLAIEKTNNSDQIIAYQQQAFEAFNQFLLQIQAVGMGDGIPQNPKSVVNNEWFSKFSFNNKYQLNA